MRPLSILTLAVTLMTMSGTAGGATSLQGKAGQGRLVVLFGARWCAPCMAEYQQLSGLAAAVAPDRLVLAWIDRPIAPPSDLARNVVSLPSNEARQLAHHVGGEGYGLPFTAMFNPAGHLCALYRSPLHAADIPMMRTQCDR